MTNDTIIKKTSLLLICYAVLCLIGCASFPHRQEIFAARETDYLKARTIPPLKIPPGLSSTTITSQFPIADRHDSESAKQIDLTPPGLGTAGSSIQRHGSKVAQ